MAPISASSRFCSDIASSRRLRSALYAKVSTRTIHAVAGPLDRLMVLMEGKTPDG
ncbi:hypothetical protein [Hoeflea sp.]|uniref:hypothetical protein n=1 Tax=Hoeflea sp. TaxID=1940281 RepID=UPI003A925E97